MTLWRAVSVLFNEPKLLKCDGDVAPKNSVTVSVLFNEPKLLKLNVGDEFDHRSKVSVLFNEPKLLKSCRPSPASR